MKNLKLFISALLLVFVQFQLSISQVKVGGYIQTHYIMEFKDKFYSTFKPGTINLKFSGKLDDNLNWVLQFGVKEKDFNKFLKDYYIEVLNPFNLKGLGLRVGQFKYHWSIERSESSSDRKTIHRSQVVSALVADRDIGVEVSYNISNLMFALGIWNGEVVYKNHGSIYETIDYTRNIDDFDSKKDITSFIGLRNLKFGDGGRLNLNFSFLFGSNGRYSISRKDRFGFGADFTDEKLSFRNEIILGRDDSIKKTGFYLQMSYKFSEQFEPILKYDFWDSNTDEYGYVQWFTAGIFSKISDVVVFRLNYIFKLENPDAVKRKNDELSLILQIKF